MNIIIKPDTLTVEELKQYREELNKEIEITEKEYKEMTMLEDKEYYAGFRDGIRAAQLHLDYIIWKKQKKAEVDAFYNAEKQEA